ncbi:MAG TPA: hypothetical protein VM260_26730 [Pirellula sp.]|nr:hypothetical protein [Pirellula sp.]
MAWLTFAVPLVTKLTTKSLLYRAFCTAVGEKLPLAGKHKVNSDVDQVGTITEQLTEAILMRVSVPQARTRRSSGRSR